MEYQNSGEEDKCKKGLITVIIKLGKNKECKFWIENLEKLDEITLLDLILLC